ncbi:MAG TPA: hypothetical protein H9674_06310 [Firmicutes bacterium]|nr:hypothetical protein [Bacillota bacterium]HJD23288.1 hypothetical protein [Bacillota bacterium]
MGLFGRRKTSEDRETAALLARLDGKSVKYVTRRDPATQVETVIGHEGRLNTKDGQIVIVCNGTEVFRCPSAGARCGELLSLDGVTIRTDEGMVVAYYQYYR